MKNILLTAFSVLLFSLVAQAYETSLDGLSEEYCIDKKIVKNGAMAVCKAENMSAVIKSKPDMTVTLTEEEIAKLTIYDVIELGIMPDADTNHDYFYTRWLVSESGERVGYMSIIGYNNSEMDLVGKSIIKYNLKGQLVSVKDEYLH